jgi:hypothetical protein
MFADGVRNVIAGASAIDLKRGLGSRWKKPSAEGDVRTGVQVNVPSKW